MKCYRLDEFPEGYAFFDLQQLRHRITIWMNEQSKTVHEEDVAVYLVDDSSNVGEFGQFGYVEHQGLRVWNIMKGCMGGFFLAAAPG